MSNIRYNIGVKKLSKHKQKPKNEALVPFDSIREVGIVYDVNQKSSLLTKIVHHFESEGKKVFTLGYVNSKELGDYVPNLKEGFYCKKDLGFFGIPKKESISSFINKDFDYLINLDTKGRIELQAVSTFSLARTRIGKHLDLFQNAHDFMVKGIAETEEEIFNEIIKYIK
ncbi:MAG: hypothetical protein HKP14_10915 [Bacteroidia bacterium]|nr:hypothetical protein [Bacteroidia bacterium]